jgi:hypothetical protein
MKSSGLVLAAITAVLNRVSPDFRLDSSRNVLRIEAAQRALPVLCLLSSMPCSSEGRCHGLRAFA